MAKAPRTEHHESEGTEHDNDWGDLHVSNPSSLRGNRLGDVSKIPVPLQRLVERSLEEGPLEITCRNPEQQAEARRLIKLYGRRRNPPVSIASRYVGETGVRFQATREDDDGDGD